MVIARSRSRLQFVRDHCYIQCRQLPAGQVFRIAWRWVSLPDPVFDIHNSVTLKSDIHLITTVEEVSGGAPSTKASTYSQARCDSHSCAGDLIGMEVYFRTQIEARSREHLSTSQAC